jgi:glutathione S-transferase
MFVLLLIGFVWPWIEYCNSSFQPSCCGLVFELDEKKHAPIKQALNESLDFIEAALSKKGNGDYWLGKKLSLVDLTFYPFFEHACVLSYYRGFELSDKYQHIHQWLKTMQNRQSVQKNCQTAEFYIEAYKPFVDGSIDH